MTTPDSLLREFIPLLNGYMVNKYRWVERRGHCLLTMDDLIQVAMIELVKLAQKWDEIRARDGIAADNRPAFMAYLKMDVKAAIYTYTQRATHTGAEFVNDSFDDRLPDAETSAAETRTSLRIPDTQDQRLLIDALVDYFSLLPRKDKLWLALRYFDELPTVAATEVMGKDYSAVASHTRDRFRAFARNLWAEHPTEVERPNARRWAEPETLTAYVRDRHRMDVDEYLGYVTICFRQDISYLVVILGKQWVYSPVSYKWGDEAEERLRDTIHAALDEGLTQAQIASILGVSQSMIQKRARHRVA